MRNRWLPAPRWNTLECPCCLSGFTKLCHQHLLLAPFLPASHSEVKSLSSHHVSGTASGEPTPLEVRFQPTAVPKLVRILDPRQGGCPWEGRQSLLNVGDRGGHLESLAWVSGVWKSWTEASRPEAKLGCGGLGLRGALLPGIPSRTQVQDYAAGAGAQ